MHEQKAHPARVSKDGNYKFKYIYLVLSIAFVILIIATYYLPSRFPDVFVNATWLLEKDSDGNEIIKTIPQSSAYIILELFREVFVTGLVGVILYAFYEHRFETEEKKMLFENVNAIISETIDDHFINAILGSEETYQRVFSGGFTDGVLRNCLLQETGSADKTDAIMQTIIGSVIAKSSIIHDADVCMTLEDFNDSSHRFSRYDSYKMVFAIRYKVILDTDKFEFLITNSKEIQNKHLGVFSMCMYVDSAFSGREVYFVMKEFTIDDKPLSSYKRESSGNYVCYKYDGELFNSKRSQEVQIAYRVEFLLRKNSNYYSYFTPALTKGIHLKFEANSTDIKRARVISFFISGHQPNISTEGINPKSAEVTLNDWVLPSSGAVLIWQFEERGFDKT